MISIVTVVKNNLSGIVRTHDSIFLQNLSLWQWIIVDGYSTDGTSDFIKQLDDPRIKIQIGKDRGLYDAMNIGTTLADGSHILYLNSGDVFSSIDSLFCINETSIKSPNSVILGGANYIDNQKVKVYRAPRDAARSTWYGNPSIHQAVLFPKSLIGSEPYDINYKICADYALFAKLLKETYPYTLLDTPIVDFELGGTSQKHMFLLIKEASIVQYRILNVPISLIVISSFIRFLKLLAISVSLRTFLKKL